MGKALEACKALGCTIVPVHLPPPAEVVKIHGIILLSEAAAYYEQAKLADHPGLPALPRANIDAARGFSAIQYAQATQTRSEEHTSELQSLMRISYAVFCLKKKIKQLTTTNAH